MERGAGALFRRLSPHRVAGSVLRNALSRASCQVARCGASWVRVLPERLAAHYADTRQPDLPAIEISRKSHGAGFVRVIPPNGSGLACVGKNPGGRTRPTIERHPVSMSCF